MIASRLPAAAPAGGPAGSAATGPEAHAEPAADSGFAHLLTPTDTSTAPPAGGTNAEATPVSKNGTSADRSPDTAADDTATDPDLATRLLALIGLAAIPAAAPPPAADTPAPSLASMPSRPPTGTLLRGTPLRGTPLRGTLPTAANAGVAVTDGNASLPAQASQAVLTGAVAATADGTTTAATSLPTTSAPTAPLARAMAPQADPSIAANAGAITDFTKLPGLTAEVGKPGVEGVTAADTGLDAVGDRGPLLTGTQPGNSTRATASAALPGAPLAMPANPEAGFDDSFGARIGWMAEQRIGRAELRVSPDQFGTIDIRLQMDGNRVSADFHSASADVRHALEQSVGRLRDMLDQQGMQLAHAGVGHGGKDGERDHTDAAGSEPGHQAGESDEGLAEVGSSSTLVRNRGLLDEYA